MYTSVMTATINVFPCRSEVVEAMPRWELCAKAGIAVLWELDDERQNLLLGRDCAMRSVRIHCRDCMLRELISSNPWVAGPYKA